MRTTNQQLYCMRRLMTLLALILIATAACSDDKPSPQETQSQADGQLNDGAQTNGMDASVDVADALADLRKTATRAAPSRVTIDLNGDGSIKILLLSSSRGISLIVLDLP